MEAEMMSSADREARQINEHNSKMGTSSKYWKNSWGVAHNCTRNSIALMQ
jgi:hypothetical protein